MIPKNRPGHEWESNKHMDRLDEIRPGDRSKESGKELAQAQIEEQLDAADQDLNKKDRDRGEVQAPDR